MARSDPWPFSLALSGGLRIPGQDGLTLPKRQVAIMAYAAPSPDFHENHCDERILARKPSTRCRSVAA